MRKLLGHGLFIALISVLLLFAQPVMGQETPITGQSSTKLNTDPSVEFLKRWTPRSLTEAKEIEAAIKVVAAERVDTTVCLSIGDDPEKQVQGSGTLVSSDGLIVTAAHVVSNVGTKCRIYLSDGSCYDGETLGLSKYFDYALVKMNNPPSNLKFSSMGNSAAVHLGEWVVLFGQPLGLEEAPFRSPVMRTGRVRAVLGTRIVTDAPLVPGDSGGGLFNLAGELIGINVSIYAMDAQINNCAPINRVRHTWDALLASQEIEGSQDLWREQFVKRIEAMYSLTDKKRFNEALVEIDAAIKMDDQIGDPYYHKACLYFRWAVSLAPSAPQRRTFLSLGLGCFQQAVDKGWADLQHLFSDADLNVVRNDPLFIELLRKMQRALDFSGYLGVKVVNTEGVLVISQVTAGSPAAAAGLQSGDHIIAVDGAEAKDDDQLRDLVSNKRAGDRVRITIKRKLEELEISCILAARGAIAEELPNGRLKNGPELLAPLSSLTNHVKKSILKVKDSHVLGVVVRGDGYIIAKASEIKALLRENSVEFIMHDGTAVWAELAGEDQRSDLALFKSPVDRLPVINWYQSKLVAGQFLFSVGFDKVISLGATSLVDFMDFPRIEVGYLGLSGRAPPSSKLKELGLEGGVEVVDFGVDSPALKVGMQIGDIIYKLDGTSIQSVRQLTEYLVGRGFGTSIVIHYFRDGVDSSVVINSSLHWKTKGWPDTPYAKHLRRPFSGRNLDFGTVTFHDGLIEPSQTGSLVLDLEGRVVGLNIARYDRSRTIMLSAERVQALAQWMIGQSESKEEADPKKSDDY